MKGIVFTFGRKNRAKRRLKDLRLPDIRLLFRRCGVTLCFVILILLGMILGAMYSRSADEQTLKSLDFLFTTNLDSRLTQSVMGTFCACFASDCIFLISVYLFGCAPWGLPFELAAVLFKGFGIGVTAAFLFLTHGLSGVGFYLLVLLPGTFLFCVALALFSGSAFEFSKRMFSICFSKTPPEAPVREGLLKLSSRLVNSLILTFAAALLDTLLWSLFAGAFKF